MTAPPVSLLMPNRDNGPVLDLVLQRLAANTQYENFELLVVDDGSTDGSLQILRRWRDSGRLPELNLIEREHGGVVEALNAGLAAATGELVVQLDADASVETPGWVQRMVDSSSATSAWAWSRARSCSTGARTIPAASTWSAPTDSTTAARAITEPAGARVPPADRPAPGGRLRRLRLGRRGGRRDRLLHDVQARGGVELGGYDPGWAPVWFDDLDLTMCMRREGLKVFYLPDVRVIHHSGRRA